MGQRIGTAVGSSAQRQPLTFTLVLVGLLLAYQMPAAEEVHQMVRQGSPQVCWKLDHGLALCARSQLDSSVLPAWPWTCQEHPILQ